MTLALLETVVPTTEARNALAGWRLRNAVYKSASYVATQQDKAKHDVSDEARNEHGEWTSGPTTVSQRYPWLPAGGMEEPASKKISPIVSSAKAYVIRQRLPDKHMTVTLKNGETREREVPQFRWFDSVTHKEIKDEARTSAYRKLIPPSGTHAIVNPDPTAYHQATWLNKNDLIQYAYVKGHEKSAAGEKYARLKAFNKVLPKVRKQILEDMDSDDDKLAQAALITYVIDKTGFRLGGETSERARGHYGASSLLNKHVKINGDKVQFDFVGKEGTEQHHIVHDQVMADHLSKYKRAQWSQPLFSVSSTRVGKYVKDISGDDFSPKDFRTWNGTFAALKLIAKRKGPASTERQFKEWQKGVAVKVGEKLGHSSPSMSLNNYIDPHVWQKWRKPEWGEWLPKKMKDSE